MDTPNNNLTEGSIERALIRFSFPLLLSYFLQALYGVADTIIVSRFSDLANVTGVTQGSQITAILTACVAGFSGGGTVLIAQYAGANKQRELEETMKTIFAFFVLLALIFTVLLLSVSRWCIGALQVPAEAQAACRSYLNICVFGTVFVFLFNGVNAVLQALGNSKKPLLFVGVAVIINVGLDLLLVGVWELGAAGAAVATVASQLCSVLVAIASLRRRNFAFDFRPRSFRIYPDKARMLFRLGLPYAFQRTIVSLSFLLISGLSNGYGLLAAAASGVISKINQIATLPFSAINVAIASTCGQNLGARQIDRAKEAFRSGMKLTFAVGAAIFCAVQAFPDALLRIFSASPALLETAIPFLRFYCISYLLMPFSYSINALMTGSGYTLVTMLNGLIAALILRVPLAWLFSRVLGMGFPGIALGSSLAVCGAVISGVFFYRSGVWKKPLLQEKV